MIRGCIMRSSKTDTIDRTPRFLFDNTEGKNMQDGFTLVVCFSRNWCVGPFFKAFNKLRIDLDKCHLLIFDNTDNVLLENSLKRKVDIYKDIFYTTRLYKSWRKGGDQRMGAEDRGFHYSKLPYIYAMHLDFLKMITTDKFVLLEDDTLPPPMAVHKLLQHLEKNPDVGVATAIATGRSPFKFVKTRLGVHYIKRKGNKILERITPRPYLEKARIKTFSVDACGWYCCASYKHLWELGFKGMDKFLSEIPRFALDNFHTNNIKRAGWDILADFSLQCKHMNLSGGRILYWTIKQAVPMLDIWIPKYKTYAQGVIIKCKRTTSPFWRDYKKNCW